ncbi:MAG: DUF4203 domain-containing protein [Actinobacteria bacterium]|nr:DUF4203 domain-containing protein [Actinomycetota bacterium]
MSHIWVGIITLLIGALFCFRGNVALRAVMALWGAFVGFWLGAGAASGLSGEPLLGGPISWIVALLVALLFGVLAYAFYALAVVIGMGSIGLGLGTAITAGLGVENSAVVIAVGVLGAVALAILAVTTNLPYVLLVVVSAIGGAAAMVGGLILVLGVVTLDADQAAIQDAVGTQWWWTVVHLALAVAGVVVQLRSGTRTDVRREWRQVEAPRS